MELPAAWRSHGVAARVALVVLIVLAGGSHGASLLSTCSGHVVTWPLPSTCSAYRDCHRALCRCANALVSMDGTCSVANRPCAPSKPCLETFAGCVAATAANQSSSEAACAALGQSVYLSQLSSLASGYATSNYRKSCLGLICNVTNNTCAYDADQHPCASIATTSFTPHPTIVDASYLLRAKILFRGSNFPRILGNETRHAMMVSALVADLAAYVGLPQAAIAIFSLRGEMELDFGVLSERAPFDLGRLMVSVESIRYGPTFLTNAGAVYRLANANASDFAVTRVVVLSTLPPTETAFVATDHPTPAPPINAAPSAAVGWLALAAAMVAAAGAVLV